ncbi:MAG: replicative DNA helicase [Bacteroidetes bacterium]|nr:replicative DNA helicase [Bacteroidota bacterium]
MEPGADRSIKKRAAKVAANLVMYNEHGKVPPQARDVEQIVLGAILLERNALNSVIDVLKPEAFYDEANGKIFAAIQHLFHTAQPIDLITVTNELKSRGELSIVGGPYYISTLTNRVASAANIEFHARIIIQKYIQRELIRISTETIKDAFEDTTDVLVLLDKAEKNLFAIAEGNLRKQYDNMQTLISKAIKEYERAAAQPDGVIGTPSGFSDLDAITSGWQKSDLIIIAARPGMGKTAFVLSLARNAAVQFKKAVAVFSLEMSSVQLVNRLISSETEISGEKLRKGNLNEMEWQQLNKKIQQLEEAPIYIDDTPAISIFELRAKCRRLVAERKVELIIVDYLQLMQAGGEMQRGNREQEISTISRSLKSIAKELEVPIITLSQLSRSVETRGGIKRPQLSDLRESGAIEQDADMVIFIYRPEYYGVTEDEANNSTAGLAEIIVAKNRNGSLKTVNLQFINHLTKFADYANYSLVDETSPAAFGGPQPRISKFSRMDDLPDEDALF